MSDTITSPNMSLPVPIVSQDPGPDWANNYNACLSIVDQHNHTSGSGVPLSQDSLNLTPAATSFNSLSFNNSNAYALRSVRFTAQVSALALATDVGCLYEAGVDLYYNDGSGNQIRLTQGGSIVGTSGSITGLPSGTASAAYSGGTFVWQSATSTAANMDAGSYIYRNATASSKGLTLSPPNAMAADYGLVLPALPGVTSIMALDTSGNITAPYTVDNSTIAIVSSVIGVKSGGLTTTQLSATAGILKSQLAALGQQISSSCGAFAGVTSSTFADVTNLSITITTSGRPIFIGIISDGSGAPNNSYFGIFRVSGTPTSMTGLARILRGATEIVRQTVTIGGAASGAMANYTPSSSIWTIDIPAAGTYTYKVQVASDGVTNTAQIVYSKLVAYEL